MGNVSSVLTSPIESVVSCGGAFDNVEGAGLFSDVIPILLLLLILKLIPIIPIIPIILLYTNNYLLIILIQLLTNTS